MAPVHNRFDSVFYYYLVVYCTHQIKMPNANVCRQADLKLRARPSAISAPPLQM